MNRKKLLWMVLVLAGMLPTRAEEYGYLTFELTDGAKASSSGADQSVTVPMYAGSSRIHETEYGLMSAVS